MLLPVRCPVCDARGAAPCGRCITRMRAPAAFTPPPALDACVASLSYRGAARELVARLKYRNARAAVAWLATAMAAAAAPVVNAASVDVVTWVPTTPARRRERGFDQGELLARALARRLHRPCRALLHRGAGPAQTGADAAARRNATPALRVRRRPPPAVLLVDDVVTTGATLSAAAVALRAAGARRVVGVVAARTPAPGDLH